MKPDKREPVLELGSGAGFLDEMVQGLITSDIIPAPHVSMVLDAHTLPFRNRSLGSIVMIDVLHHLSRPRSFFSEASCCVASGGKIVMIEPWVTPWSRLVFSRFHHEPFHPDAESWEFPSGAPLSAANGALPRIIFRRDRPIFEQEFPEWQIESIKLSMPLSYLLSGGASMRSFMPGTLCGLWRSIEHLMDRWGHKLALFATIVIAKGKCVT